MTTTIIPAGTTLRGDGSLTLQTWTPGEPVAEAGGDGAALEDVNIVGCAGGAGATEGVGALFSGVAHGDVAHCDISAMDGTGVLVTAGAYRVRALFCHIHDLSGTLQNSADVSFYGAAWGSMALGNYLLGGPGAEVGVVNQLDGIKNIAALNFIAHHTTYGILAGYENTPKHTYLLAVGNYIEDIDGSTLNGNSGAGIYTVATGLNLLALNQIRNTNLLTTGEMLAPGGIGIVGAFSPVLTLGNVISDTGWYGMIVASSVDATIDAVGNTLFEPKRGAYYIKSSSHVNIVGGSVTQLESPASNERAVNVNTSAAGTYRGVSTIGVRIRGASTAAEYRNTNGLVVSGLNISETTGHGIKLDSGDGAVVAGNMVDVSSAPAANALILSDQKNASVTGNVFKSANAICIYIAGNCQGCRVDKSNVLIGMDANNIWNQGAGCTVETWGSGPPTQGYHQRGDIVWNAQPSAGVTPAWVCVTSGQPGTWKAMRTLV